MTTSVEIRDTKPSKFAQLRESLTTNKKRIGERSLLVATTLFMAMPAWARQGGGSCARAVRYRHLHPRADYRLPGGPGSSIRGARLPWAGDCRCLRCRPLHDQGNLQLVR